MDTIITQYISQRNALTAIKKVHGQKDKADFSSNLTYRATYITVLVYSEELLLPLVLSFTSLPPVSGIALFSFAG